MAPPRTRSGIAGLVLVGLLVAFALAAVASPFASGSPDGLDKVASDHGFDAAARDSAAQDSPLANYAVRNVDDERVTKRLAGVIGVTVTLVVAVAVFGGLGYVVRRRAVVT